MGKFTNYSSIKAGALFFFYFFLLSENLIKIKGNYILYSHDDKYIYASGSLTIKVLGQKIKGNTLFFSIRSWKGEIRGDVIFKDKRYDLLRLEIKDKKLKWYGIKFGDKIEKKGDKLSSPQILSPDKLRKAALYFEAKEVEINKYGKVKGKYVLPYALGAPSFPMSSFVLDMGHPPPKTSLRPSTFRFTREDGTVIGVALDLKEKIYQGTYELRYFERELFKIPGTPRGIIFSGYGGFRKKGKSILENNIYYTSEGKYIDMSIYTSKEGKVFSFSAQTRMSSREYEKPYHWLSTTIRLKKFKSIQPEVQLGWDYRNSYKIGLFTYLFPHKNLRATVSWEKNYQETSYVTTSTSTASFYLSYTPSIFNLSARAFLSDDLIEKTQRKDTSINFALRPIKLLDGALNTNFQFFFMFSKFPYGNDYAEKISPGLRIGLNGVQFSLPLGFYFTPNIDINQIWEKGKTSWTEINYYLSFERKIWKFNLSVDFSMNSRYKSGGFWIEGYNNYYLSPRIEFSNLASSFRIMAFINKEMTVERITAMGEVGLFLGFRIRFYSIYNPILERMSVLEMYLEKNLRNAIKLQLGYSLSMKKYFFRIIPL